MALGLTRSGKISALVALVLLVALGAGVYLVQSKGLRRTLKSFIDGGREAAGEPGFLPHRMYPTVDSLAQIGSGWIALGPYDAGRRAYREGPYAEVAVCVAGDGTGPVVPHRGDVLRILRPMFVAIGNYRVEGLAYREIPPPKVHEILGQIDLTGLRLATGELVVALDVQAPWRLGKPRSIWCRVGPCDPASEPCAQALREGAGKPASP
jgi:hypothetical protein